MSATYAYVGVEPCGCVSAAVVDMPDHAKDVAKAVAEMIQHGSSVQRVTIEQCRALGFGCKHNPKWGRGEPTPPSLFDEVVF